MPHRSPIILAVVRPQRDIDNVNCHVDVGLLSGHARPRGGWEALVAKLMLGRLRGSVLRRIHAREVASELLSGVPAQSAAGGPTAAGVRTPLLIGGQYARLHQPRAAGEGREQ